MATTSQPRGEEKVLFIFSAVCCGELSLSDFTTAPERKGFSDVYRLSRHPQLFPENQELVVKFNECKETVASLVNVRTLCCCICVKSSPQGLSPELNRFKSSFVCVNNTVTHVCQLPHFTLAWTDFLIIKAPTTSFLERDTLSKRTESSMRVLTCDSLRVRKHA